MINKKIIIIFSVVALGIVLAMLYFVFRSDEASNTQPPDQSFSDNRAIESVVKTYYELYTTYEYGDYSNFYALGDYSTADQQEKLLLMHEDLSEKTPEGYLQIGTTDLSGINIFYINSVEASVVFDGSIETTLKSGSSPQTSRARAEISLFKIEGFWKVNNITVR